MITNEKKEPLSRSEIMLLLAMHAVSHFSSFALHYFRCCHPTAEWTTIPLVSILPYSFRDQMTASTCSA